MMKRIAVAVAFFVMLSLPLNGTAGIAPSPFLLPDLAGFDNPMFWVMFNPQPEPPGSWHTDYTDLYAPVITVHMGAGEPLTSFPVSFGIQGATVPLTTVRNPPTLNVHEIMFSIYQGSLSLELVYTATFSFGSDVMFNPQPEPPITPWTFFLGDGAGGPFQGRDVAMTLRLTNGAGDPVALHQSVPEPTTILLLSLGLIGLVGIRKTLQFR